MNRLTWRLLTVVSIVFLAACGNGQDVADPGRPAHPADEVGGDLTVFGAASLTEAFTALGAAFGAQHPEVDIRFNFAASSELAAQIEQGAPADVFASADSANMAKLVDAGATDGDPVVFGVNSAIIVVAPGNPLGLGGVTDLTDPDLVLVTCAPEVPCGAYASQVFSNAGLDVTPDSYEQNVKSVVTKVMLGEADAGIAYTTDVIAADGEVDGVDIPADLNVRAEYPLVVTGDAPNAAAATAFVEFVTSGPGRTILVEFGFVAP